MQKQIIVANGQDKIIALKAICVFRNKIVITQ
jgi:hypothetical protein